MERNNLGSFRRGAAGAWSLIWPIIRQVLGWMFILLGLLGLVLPVLQGVLFLAIGIALVGRRNWLIRRSTLVFKRFLRRWARSKQPLLRASGRVALRAQWKCSREARHLHRRYADWRQRRTESRIEVPIGDAPDVRYDKISDRV